MEPFCECSLPYWCLAAITNLLRGSKIYDNFSLFSLCYCLLQNKETQPKVTTTTDTTDSPYLLVVLAADVVEGE